VLADNSTFPGVYTNDLISPSTKYTMSPISAKVSGRKLKGL
jgi:hypothetical protein